ncbi:PucR family transcriptional regulator [Planococcus lenghuensis]|uniref:PucR family transcriptional regulator n=1 Tax=Planococcus lenghuensis TaxID=2213202 RepID=A0A1Q2KW56_9BACL|nr:PucR family transcriptional regulator [Planococcus lenghuensis]AQQ52356.1 hypothetical protein B0X71_04005 [Planococcus lenghuensis]
MNITVQEALQLPVMAKARLVAGAAGIHRPIRWVTIVEVIEDINRLQPGEFLITTAYGLADNRQHFLDLLRMNKLSGVALYTGFYLKEMPASFIEAANASGLPLIDIPSDINFSAITEGILQEIANRQTEIISSSLNTHKELTGLVLKGGGEETVTHTLAKLTETSVFLLNEIGEMTQAVPCHPRMADRDFGGHPVFADCRESFRPVEIEEDDLHLLVHPIVADNVFYGAIISGKPKNAWKETDRAVIEHAATVYAIERLKSDAVEQTQVRLRGEFLEEILHKNFRSRSAAVEHGRKFGFDLSRPHTVLHLKLAPPLPGNGQTGDLQAHVTAVLGREKLNFLMKERLEAITVLLPMPAADCAAIAEMIHMGWDTESSAIRLIIGLGRTYEDVSRFSESAAEAVTAADLHDLLLNQKEIIHYDELGTYQLLLQVKDSGGDLSSFYRQVLGSLIRSNGHGIDFIATLTAYFKHNFNTQAAAEELFIHRHTLKYRLNQAQQKCGWDLDSADERLKLQLAVAAYRLDQHLEN